jgi:hypothetical protein
MKSELYIRACAPRWRSGYAVDCRSAIPRFKSGPWLSTLCRSVIDCSALSVPWCVIFWLNSLVGLLIVTVGAVRRRRSLRRPTHTTRCNLIYRSTPFGITRYRAQFSRIYKHYHSLVYPFYLQNQFIYLNKLQGSLNSQNSESKRSEQYLRKGFFM